MKKIEFVNGTTIDGASIFNQMQDNVEDAIDQLIATELIIFGDSWSDLDVDASVWSTRASNVLGLNLTNYAKSGAGFVKPESNLISTQITNFSESDIDKSKVKYIVLLGGINDYRNSVDGTTLVSAIKTAVNSLQTLCPKAKILYVSNCQYPYTESQSTYWKTLHDNLSTSLSISTYNLDGNIGKLLYNTDNYFHLTQAGQKWMAKNIICALTGGELTKFKDARSFSNENCEMIYIVEKISTNISLVQIILTPLIASSSYSITLDEDEPNLAYGADLKLQGSISWLYANLICDCSNTKISIVADKNLSINNEYVINMIVTY